MKKNIVNRVVWDKPKAKKKKEIDFFEIKKALSDQPSANLELIIQQCVSLLKRKYLEEYMTMVRLASTLKKSDIAKLMADSHLG